MGELVDNKVLAFQFLPPRGRNVMYLNFVSLPYDKNLASLDFGRKCTALHASKNSIDLRGLLHRVNRYQEVAASRG
jgi:hypothetical protein